MLYAGLAVSRRSNFVISRPIVSLHLLPSPLCMLLLIVPIFRKSKSCRGCPVFVQRLCWACMSLRREPKVRPTPQSTHAPCPLLQRLHVTPTLDSDLTEGPLVKLGTGSPHSLSSCTNRAERRVGVRKVRALMGRGVSTLLVRIVDRSWDTVGKV